MRVRGIRGAIAVPEDARDAVLDACERVVREMMLRNVVEAPDLVSVIFTATEDLRSAFPAEAARRAGLTNVPLLCAREIDVEGAMPRVIRVLMHVNAEETDSPVEHVYLDGAESLRDDL